MKRLILLRHAKAEAAGHGEDHARDLAPRGAMDAAWAGASIASAGWDPDLALVSDARRTRATFDALAQHLAEVPRHRLEARLYEASPDDILAVIAATGPEVACLLVVGHNPGVAQTALRLARGGDADAVARLGRGFPTATIAAFSLPTERWEDVAAGGILDALLTPR